MSRKCGSHSAILGNPSLSRYPRDNMEIFRDLVRELRDLVARENVRMEQEAMTLGEESEASRSIGYREGYRDAAGYAADAIEEALEEFDL